MCINNFGTGDDGLTNSLLNLETNGTNLGGLTLNAGSRVLSGTTAAPGTYIGRHRVAGTINGVGKSAATPV